MSPGDKHWPGVRLTSGILFLGILIFTVPATRAILLYSFEEGTEIGSVVAKLREDADLTGYSQEVRDKLTFKLMPTEFDNR